MGTSEKEKGTSGNRKGFKVFSINTTVRNPKRNTEFLKYFQEFDGKLFTKELSERYFFNLIKYGVYRVTDIPEYVKNKMDNGEELTSSEVHSAIKNNPQATGLYGRVMTQLRAMKDQGFLAFNPIKRGLNQINITRLGKELIENKEDPTIVYTKAMLGMHANSPIRTQIFNKSRPFLNTLFVIKEVNQKWRDLGHEPKGLLKHEFATFVLSMKNCDYKTAANNIIEYRKQYRYEAKYEVLKNYLIANDILPIAEKSLLNDYPDDIFRKFEMTGLIKQRGQFNYIYYDFSSYNIEKVESILQTYKGYVFETFNNAIDYYNYLYNMEIPWLSSELIRKKIIESKIKILNISIDNTLTLKQQEEYLDRFFYTKTLENVIQNIDTKLINKELLILSGTVKEEESKYKDIPEPLRLEYLLALLIGKNYGLTGLISNIIYGEDGLPLHFAPASKCDIIYLNQNGSYIFEPTMQRGKNQQLNNETANIVRHMQNEMQQTKITYRVMMIAPYVHIDVANYFQYEADKKSVKIAPLSIDKIVGLVYESKSISELNNNFDTIVNFLINSNEQQYIDKINNYSVDKNAYNI